MKEKNIRPKKLFDKYTALSRMDAKKFFIKSNKKKITCPACKKFGNFFLEKDNFKYDKCPKCLTIYVSPRHDSKIYQQYYSMSDSAKFWATDFYKKTLKERIKRLWKPKAKHVQAIIKKEKKITNIIDIGAGYGLFLNEIKKNIKINTFALEPSKLLGDICKGNNHILLNYFLENLPKNEIPKGKNIYTCFELFEHLHDPQFFLKKLYNCMKKNEIVILTTLSGIGLDIDILGKFSQSIQPPYHINFFNPDSIKILLEKNNFKIIDISTPGKLDMDILINNYDKIDNPFWKKFIKKSSTLEKNNMQKFIQKNNLSSHMSVIFRK
jgi:SAM-dependent methyltransferase|tara:strand:- start:332 stop:1303 length:972 start_codon:yes stop_codon:yes gene_type:complete